MTIWQGLGGWVATARNLGVDKLDKFKSVGGSWICVVIYNDSAQDENRAALPGIKAQCNARGIKVLGWYNGFGDDPTKMGKEVVGIHNNLGLDGIILDLESQYQYPGGNANLMPQLLKVIRGYLPNAEMAVTTNGMNDSMIFNGRVLDPPQSFYDMRVRCIPQWYDAYYSKDGHTQPQYNMKWLKDNGNKSGNFRDENAVKTSYRGLPLSYVHPVIEGTGIEDSHLQAELDDLTATRQYGLTPGFSYYLLERAPDEDFPILQKYKGVLYLA